MKLHDKTLRIFICKLMFHLTYDNQTGAFVRTL